MLTECQAELAAPDNGCKSLSISALQDALREKAKGVRDDPLTNSIFSLARELFRDLEDGQILLSDVERLLQEIDIELAKERASIFRSQHFNCYRRSAWRGVTEKLTLLAKTSPEKFIDTVETPNAGLVFTAHPTFSHSQQYRAAFAASVENPTAKSFDEIGKINQHDPSEWFSSISLDSEHEETIGVLRNAHLGMRRYLETLIDVALENLPEEVWRKMRPAPPRISSWVGYDLDGRSDIHWTQSFVFRLKEKSLQIRSYLDRLKRLSMQAPNLLEKIERTIEVTDYVVASFDQTDADTEEFLTTLTEFEVLSEDLIKSSAELLQPLDEWISSAQKVDAKELIALRSEIEALELGLGRIHLRVNSSAISEVIRDELSLGSQEERLGRQVLADLSTKSKETAVVSRTFHEMNDTERRAHLQFQLCAKILHLVDERSPIRFLIAESENPATVMGALFLARLYGIEDRVDISPLFETPEALENGARFIEKLLDVPEFRTYLKQRGRLSVQFGFSDSGRFVGQIAANMAIERLHHLIGRALTKHDLDVGLLIFNTHGESMGRGSYPGSFQDRFDHLLTPWVKSQFGKIGLFYAHEVSFQGGDGFLHFQTPLLAEMTYAALCDHALNTPSVPETTDPYYDDKDFVWDTYKALTNWHEELFGNPEYTSLLTGFAGNLLMKTGSRQRKRSGSAQGSRALRAIPHNALLQQVAAPANTALGFGSSVGRNGHEWLALEENSIRAAALIRLILKARSKTSIPVLRAYAAAFNPDFWNALSSAEKPKKSQIYARVYESLIDSETTDCLRKLANGFNADLAELDRLLSRSENSQDAADRHEQRLLLHILHAVRQALIMHALSYTAATTERFGAEASQQALRFVQDVRLAEAVDTLSASSQTSKAETRSKDMPSGDVITRLKEVDRLLTRSTLAVAHAYGAFG